MQPVKTYLMLLSKSSMRAVSLFWLFLSTVLYHWLSLNHPSEPLRARTISLISQCLYQSRSPAHMFINILN